MTRRLRIYLAFVVVGVVAGSALPPSASDNSPAEMVDAWNPILAEHIPRFDHEQFRTATQIKWLGEDEAGPASTSQAPIPWRLKAIAQGAQPKALIETTPDNYLDFAIGEKLPDGSILEQITDSYIEIRTNGCLTPRRLYSQTSQDNGSADCPTSTESENK